MQRERWIAQQQNHQIDADRQIQKAKNIYPERLWSVTRECHADYTIITDLYMYIPSIGLIMTTWERNKYKEKQETGRKQRKKGTAE